MARVQTLVMSQTIQGMFVFLCFGEVFCNSCFTLDVWLLGLFCVIYQILFIDGESVHPGLPQDNPADEGSTDEKRRVSVVL